MTKYIAEPASALLVKCLRHGVCDLKTVAMIEKRWERSQRRWQEDNSHRMALRKMSVGWGQNSRHVEEEVEGQERMVPEQQSISRDNPYQPLLCPELPRRLFRTTKPTSSSFSTPSSSHRSKSSTMLTPTLLHLFTHYHPSPNSHKGYPLCRAVLANDRVLIDFLLSQGADPSLKDGLALQIAINKKDLELVRLLLEGTTTAAAGATAKRKRGLDMDESAGAGGAGAGGQERKKKKKNAEKVQVTPDLMRKVMASGSREIVDYFVHEKGRCSLIVTIHSHLNDFLSLSPLVWINK